MPFLLATSHCHFSTTRLSSPSFRWSFAFPNGAPSNQYPFHFFLSSGGILPFQGCYHPETNTAVYIIHCIVYTGFFHAALFINSLSPFPQQSNHVFPGVQWCSCPSARNLYSRVYFIHLFPCHLPLSPLFFPFCRWVSASPLALKNLPSAKLF